MAKKQKAGKPKPAWMKYSWYFIPLVAILVYLPSFNSDFTFDDEIIVQDNSYVKSLDKIPAIWTSHYWAGKIDATDTGLYRPLTLTTYNLQYVLQGEHAGPFHVINILLHALVCFVLMKFVSLLSKDPLLVAVGGLLFAVHPIHTEAVCGIVGRAELLAGLFILLAGMSYHQYRKSGKSKWITWLLLSTFAAITSKEHGFMLPVLLALQEAYYYFAWKNYSWGSKTKWVGIGSVTILAIALFVYRSSITGPRIPHELWVGVSTFDRMATAIRIYAEYTWMHIFPLKLSADYWTGEAPITGFGDWRVWLAIIAIGIIKLAALKWRSKQPIFSWGIYFFLFALLPVSNFLFAVGFVKAERILYIPGIGLIVAMAALLVIGLQHPKWKRPTIGILTFLVLFFIMRTWQRNYDWKNNFTLAAATLKTAPDSPRINNMMGLELREQQKNQEALAYFEKAVKANPKHVPALVNLGTEYRNFNRLPEAAATLEQALSLDPNTLATYVNLMSVYRSMEQYDKNVEIAEKAMEKFPTSAPVLWNAANAYQLNGNMDKANELRARAQAIDPTIGSGK